MVLSFWGSATFAEKPVKIYRAISWVVYPDTSLVDVIGNTKDEVCKVVLPFSTPWRIFSSEGDTITYAPELQWGQNSYICVANTFEKKSNIKSISPVGYWYSHGYCPSQHKIPTTVDEFDKFPYVMYLEKNGDCIEVCPAPVNGQRAAADCTQTVSLTPATGQTEPRPKGSEGDGKSTYDLIAKVTEGNQPKAGMALTFTAEVEAGSGGLPKTPTGRPTGNLNIKSGTTNASGEVKVTFTSPIFAGTHKVTVTCAKCTGTKKDDTETFNVKVPNLILLPADSRWEFISNDNYHKNNNTSAATRTVYYVTEQAKTNLGQMVDAIQTTPLDTAGTRFWGKIGLNDASLKWGGKFNAYVKKDGVYPPYPWNRKGQHGEHRIGTQIDLQTRLKSKEDSFVIYDRVCKPKPDQYKVVPTILFHTGGSYHFHAYLLGNIAVKLGGGYCRTMND